jgi:hypothetical protein
MLEQVRRAVRDGLVVEVDVSAGERRFAAERYYAPAVPVVRQPDREVLESACRGITTEIAATVAREWGDLEAAFALTHLAREGWNLEDLQPYLQETLARLVAEQLGRAAQPAKLPRHGLAWMEEVAALDAAPTIEEDVA